MLSVVASLFLAISGGPAAGDSTAAVASRYLTLTFDQQYDALRELYAEDVLFVDPTGDFWGGPLADGVRGRDAVINLQKSWGLTSSDFDIHEQFVVGEYAVFRGILTWATRGMPQEASTDFMTVLRVVNGRIVERLDYGDYQAAFPGGVTAKVLANASTTKKVGWDYFRAYLDEDHTRMKSLYGPSPTFQDPTAAFFGSGAGHLEEGTETIMAMMGRAFEPISGFAFDVEQSWVSNHHTVFMGTVRYTLAARALGTKADVTFEHSAVFVIEVVDGKVTAHRDFVDYSTFREQLPQADG